MELGGGVDNSYVLYMIRDMGPIKVNILLRFAPAFDACDVHLCKAEMMLRTNFVKRAFTI